MKRYKHKTKDIIVEVIGLANNCNEDRITIDVIYVQEKQKAPLWSQSKDNFDRKYEEIRDVVS